MSNEGQTRAEVPSHLQGPLAVEQSSKYFLPRSDLTYRTINGVAIADADIHQSLLTGALLRDLSWCRVVLRRSDLDGLRAERSRFDSCDFSTCDIRSSHFVGCQFLRCNFQNAFIDDCEFQDCNFTDCSFSDSSLTNCRWLSSALTACSLSPGTFLHNRLEHCTLTDMLLGDCTFLYVIFRSCSLVRVRINAESIGAIFGLTQNDIQTVGLIYLGEVEPVPPGSDVAEMLATQYELRRWYIGELVLALNFGISSTIDAFGVYLRRSHQRFLEMGFAKGDEIQFLGDILEELTLRERLPLLSATDVLRWCGELEAELAQCGHASSSDSTTGIRRLYARVNLLTYGLLERLENELPAIQAPLDEAELEIRATFQEEPAVPLHQLLNDIGIASRLQITQTTRLLRTTSGSYVEVVYTSLFTVVALQAFLFLINGCVIQLTELKHRLRVLGRRTPAKAYQDLSITPAQQASPLVLSVLQGLMQYAKSATWLKGVTLGGFSASNIQSIASVGEANSPQPPSPLPPQN